MLRSREGAASGGWSALATCCCCRRCYSIGQFCRAQPTDGDIERVNVGLSAERASRWLAHFRVESFELVVVARQQ